QRTLRWQGWRREDGGAAIEFAFVLPVFLFIFVGIFAFGLAFFMQQTMTLAAEEGARAAIAVDPESFPEGVTDAGYMAAVQTQAQALANNNLSGLPLSLRSGITTPAPTLVPILDNNGQTIGQVLTVTVAYPGFNTSPLIGPLISIFPLSFVGSLIMPTNLTATAAVQLF
ncbi:MAG: TadE/TadG family type IV pilus assembly protein, partial [Candidatus Binatia bacterium]